MKKFLFLIFICLFFTGCGLKSWDEMTTEEYKSIAYYSNENFEELNYDLNEYVSKDKFVFINKDLYTLDYEYGILTEYIVKPQPFYISTINGAEVFAHTIKLSSESISLTVNIPKEHKYCLYKIYPNGTVICDKKEITDNSANIIKNFICYWLKNKLKVYKKDVNK